MLALLKVEEMGQNHKHFQTCKNHKLLQYSGKWHNMLKISTEKARKLQTFRHSLRQCGGPYLTKCHLKTSTEVSSF